MAGANQGEQGGRGMKLTKAMKAQLLEYIKDKGAGMEYWGNEKQFRDRHDKIHQWVEEQEGV